MGTGCLQAIKYGDSFFRNCPLLSKIGFSPRIHRGHGEAIFYLAGRRPRAGFGGGSRQIKALCLTEKQTSSLSLFCGIDDRVMFIESNPDI